MPTWGRSTETFTVAGSVESNDQERQNGWKQTTHDLSPSGFLLLSPPSFLPLDYLRIYQAQRTAAEARGALPQAPILVGATSPFGRRELCRRILYNSRPNESRGLRGRYPLPIDAGNCKMGPSGGHLRWHPLCAIPDSDCAEAEMAEDFHATLGVPSDASQAQIRHAYFELAKIATRICTPNDPETAEKFKQIQRAFEELCKPGRFERRRHRAGIGGCAVFERLAEIESRSRSVWRRDPYSRKLVTMPAILLILLGLGNVMFGLVLEFYGTPAGLL